MANTKDVTRREVGIPGSAATTVLPVGSIVVGELPTPQKPGHTAPPHDPVNSWGTPAVLRAMAWLHR